MADGKIDIENLVDHWVSRASKDNETMLNLYHSGDYHWALFIGHLVLERLMKASVVKHTEKHAPFTHDLRRLAKLSGIDFNNDETKSLDTITTFNLNTRYDDFKQDFYRKCTKEYTETWISKIKELKKWIEKEL
ncbi:MAG: HEPN domain-containing protein [Pricia sp.]